MTLWSHYATSAADPSVDARLADSIRSSLEISHADRVDVRAAAELMRCTLVPFSTNSRPSTTHSASLVPRTSGLRLFEIRYNPIEARSNRSRWRFSVAHELGHTFFFDRSGERPRRLPRTATSGEEKFCNGFAAELLCPKEAFVEAFDPAECWNFSRSYEVSPQVVGLQALRSGRFRWRALLGLAVRGKPTKPDYLALRVVWAVTPPGTFVPLWDKYPDGPAKEALETGSAVARSASIDSGSLRGRFEQVAVPGPAQTVVLGIR